MASEATKIYDEKMTKTLAALDSDYATIRAGRANPHVLDKIMVDYYGAPTPVSYTHLDVYKRQQKQLKKQ